MKYLLDTDWAVDYLTGRPPAVSLVNTLLRDGVALSIVSYAEILEGILGSHDPRAARQGFRRLLRALKVLPVTRPIAERYAAMRADLRAQRKPVDPRALDLLIAATAVQHKLILVTRNKRHYQDVQAVQLY
jgi:tRNA(fMet)-specific endonuclease VapC